MKMIVDNPMPSGERAAKLKKRGEMAMCYGKRATAMSRDELLIFIGLMCENQVSQGRQLQQAAENIQSMTHMLEAGRNPNQEVL